MPEESVVYNTRDTIRKSKNTQGRHPKILHGSTTPVFLFSRYPAGPFAKLSRSSLATPAAFLRTQCDTPPPVIPNAYTASANKHTPACRGEKEKECEREENEGMNHTFIRCLIVRRCGNRSFLYCALSQGN